MSTDISSSIFVCCHCLPTHVEDKDDAPTLDGGAAETLLDQARNAGDPFLAVTLYQRVLQARPNDTAVMGEAADLMLHAGEIEAAKEVWIFVPQVLVTAKRGLCKL